MKKKNIILIIVLLVLILGFFFGIKYSTKKEVISKSVEIKGIIIDGSNNLLTVKNNNGIIYSFSTVDVDMSNVHNLIIGSPIHLTYNGVISPENIYQSGNISDVYTIESQELNNNKYPDIWDDKGLFHLYYEDAYNTLQTLSLEEKIGQILLARVPAENKVEDINTYHLGGYILFGRDTKNRTSEGLKNEIAAYQSNSPIPLIIAVDEEGGEVIRVSSNSNLSQEPFLSSQQLYLNGGFEEITNDTINKSNLLNSLGINTNLAPVADVSTDPNDYMYSRSFGHEANLTAGYIKTVILASKGLNVSYVLKHFPGYGNNVNTHTGIAIDNRSLDSFKNSDFLPFKAGIDNGAEAVLVSHNVVNVMDSFLPASLSLNVHNILRNDLNFTGIIMTDDLAMDAIKDYVDSPVVKAALAGNDMLIVSDYKTAYNDLLQAVNDQQITEEYLDSLVFKVLAWKYYKGLFI